MAGERKANCLECGKLAEPRISACNFRFAQPLTVYQELPHGQGYEVVEKNPDYWDSAYRNYDIPPDYPNLLEV